MPHVRPTAILPVKYTPDSAKNAPASIAPSIPTLMMPLSSTSSSPNAASRMGVAIAIVETRNASSIGALDRRDRNLGARKRLAHIAPCVGIEREQDKDDHRLNHLHQHRRNAFGTLHRLRTVVERAEENRRDHDAERVEPRDQRYSDRLETPAGRNFLIQAVIDGGDLDCAANPGERTAQRHRPNRERCDRDAKEIRRAAI